MIQLLPNRLSEKIKVDEAGCWLWQGSSSQGYGNVYMCGSMRLAHRCVFELLVEPIPNNMDLHHKCVKSLCCNPDHLIILSKEEHKKLHPHTRKRSHCFRGHAFTAENTYIDREGYQNCKTCRRACMETYYKSSKGRASAARKKKRTVERYRTDPAYRENIKAYERTRRRQKRGVLFGVLGGRAGENKAKTACLNGHPFDDANTLRSPGHRRCRICQRRRHRERYYRSREKVQVAGARQ